MCKETWTVIEPEGLPNAVERALRVAATPPFGPVHIAVYDKMLGNQQVTTDIIHSGGGKLNADMPQMMIYKVLLEAWTRPRIPCYMWRWVWKSGGGYFASELASHFGVPILLLKPI
ncbi:MAG: hypothetical protein CM1200mP3_16720 [Chloroflexota bacterium]|nr:MAG: hypothetical protein CM1200mP3_16720 [Chloroflexota bacterium]